MPCACPARGYQKSFHYIESRLLSIVYWIAYGDHDDSTLCRIFRAAAYVVVAYLFGSVARGQATPLSDVDIAVSLDPTAEPEAVLDRQITLLTELTQLAELEVQLTLLNDVPPLLAYEVIREAILLPRPLLLI